MGAGRDDCAGLSGHSRRYSSLAGHTGCRSVTRADAPGRLSGPAAGPGVLARGRRGVVGAALAPVVAAVVSESILGRERLYHRLPTVEAHGPLAARGGAAGRRGRDGRGRAGLAPP